MAEEEGVPVVATPSSQQRVSPYNSNMPLVPDEWYEKIRAGTFDDAFEKTYILGGFVVCLSRRN